MRKMKKSEKLIYVGLAIAVFGCVGAFVIHDKQVQAEQTVLQEKKVYETIVKKVYKAIDKAYETRSKTDMLAAEDGINQLKEKDQKAAKNKMDRLYALLKQVEHTEELLVIVEKTKAEKDIDLAQKSIDSETDKYLEKDKKDQQKRLDELKKVISEQKAKEKAEKEKQAKAKAEQEKAKAEAQAKQEIPAVEAPEAQGQEPTSAPAPQQPVEQAPQEGEQTPVDNAPYVAPEAPVQAEVPQYQEPSQPQYQAPAQPQAPAPAPQQPATGGGHGVMTQEEGDRAEEEASHMDPTKDPNSPWYKP
ncbi:hypothetical protein ACPTKN_14150 [Enterococcus faecalis]|uniref:hypothetical protein n=1 Tax=Enterococcus faecalis TaxID=1351 RepID=UPI003CC50163